MTNVIEGEGVMDTEEELEANETDHESGTDEEESGEESEVETGGDLQSDDDEGGGEANPSEASKNRANAQIERLKAEKAKLKEENDRLKEGGKVAEPNSDIMERAYLAANDIKDKDAQNEVIRLAHKFDMSVVDALDDTDIKGRVDTMIKQKMAKQSLAKGTGGAQKRNKDVAYYVSEFKKSGDFPAGTPMEMIAKATDLLAKE